MSTLKTCRSCGVRLKHSKHKQCKSCYMKNGAIPGKEYVNKEYLDTKHNVDGLSTAAIGKLCGMSHSGIRYRMMKFGVNARSQKDSGLLKCGAKNHKWKGGKPVFDGYPMTYISSHDGCVKYTADHIIIAEKALGRKLKDGEVVHHINNCRHDNRNNNLLICDKKYHLWLHRKMGEMYAIEHFPVPPEILGKLTD